MILAQRACVVNVSLTSTCNNLSQHSWTEVIVLVILQLVFSWNLKSFFLSYNYLNNRQIQWIPDSSRENSFDEGFHLLWFFNTLQLLSLVCACVSLNLSLSFTPISFLRAMIFIVSSLWHVFTGRWLRRCICSWPRSTNRIFNFPYGHFIDPRSIDFAISFRSIFAEK